MIRECIKSAGTLIWVVRTSDGWRYQRRHAVYDTSPVQTCWSLLSEAFSQRAAGPSPSNLTISFHRFSRLIFMTLWFNIATYAGKAFAQRTVLLKAATGFPNKRQPAMRNGIAAELMAGRAECAVDGSQRSLGAQHANLTHVKISALLAKVAKVWLPAYCGGTTSGVGKGK